MATTNEPLQLNLGSLRSAMSLTLHTHHASRIWHGRAAAEGRPGIVGLNGYIAQMNKMRRGSEQDDPYSDFWMLRIEDKLDQTKATLQSLREQVDQALASVPPALTLGENLNVQPVKLPLFVNAQLGFAAVYSAGRLRRHRPQADPRAPHGADRSLDARTLAQRRRACAAQSFQPGPAVPLLGLHPRRLRRQECRSAGGAGEVRRVAAGRAGGHAPLEVRAAHRAPWPAAAR
jgi:hypothetical protein